MSYILDALNKSEQERARKRTPDLSSLRDTGNRDSFGVYHFLAILLVLVLINAAGVWYFFGDRLDSPGSPAAVPAEIIAVPPSPVAAPPPTVVASARTPVAITALPAGIRSRLPAVEVTAHIYAVDSDLRMVKIDGVSRTEGDVVQPGLRLLEITETGVVLEFEDYPYILDVVEDWQLY